MDKEIVVITGISGYVGSQVCLSFLKDGTYKVRGTVRSKTNAAKIEPLKQAFGEYFDQLELVEADLLQAPSLEAAIKGAQYVVHTASPFTLVPPKNKDDIIKPAVDGTMSVCKAAAANKVKRVVITSSCVAIMNRKDACPGRKFTREDWSEVDMCDVYSESKTLAEKAAWDYQKTLKDDEKFELVCINPGLVFGPSLVKCSFTSGDIVKGMMMGSQDAAFPKVKIPVVDVRDVATCHLEGLKRPEAANQRFVCAIGADWGCDFHKSLLPIYNENYKIQTGAPGKTMLSFFGLFVPQAKQMARMYDIDIDFDNTETKKCLGVEFTAMDKAIPDMAASLIDLGYIPDLRNQPKKKSCF